VIALQVLITIVGLSVLVIVHEAGHYLAARAFGMRVLRFSIGLGPTLFRYQPKGSPTVFQIAAIPFLAYVQIAGMNPYEEIDRDDPELFPNKSVIARIVTIAAGPIANYLAASLICFALALTGMPEEHLIEPMTAGQVMVDSAAAEAGVQAGDVFLRADGQDVANVRELIDITTPRANVPTEYTIQRGDEVRTITMTPRPDDQGLGRIGVAALTEMRYPTFPVGEATRMAFIVPYRTTVAQLVGLASMLRNRTTEGLVGPVGIGKVVMEATERGVPDTFLILMFISMALGFANLLPFPGLDGGRLVFLGYEVVTRRRPNERIEAAIHTAGILFLLLVLILVTFRDTFG